MVLWLMARAMMVNGFRAPFKKERESRSGIYIQVTQERKNMGR